VQIPEYRRWYVPGGTYFFTLVTHRRRPILCSESARRCLRRAIDTVRSDWPVALVAVVLLPDHLHTVWTLPPGDDRYPIRWKRIKEQFTRGYLESGSEEVPLSLSRLRHRERGIWQRRYWEHTARDEEDLKRCVDYVH
jgi:putative transposase